MQPEEDKQLLEIGFMFHRLCLYLQDRNGFACPVLLSVYTKQTPWPLVRKGTVPTERPALVGEF
jgi:hypothetical protein